MKGNKFFYHVSKMYIVHLVKLYSYKHIDNITFVKIGTVGHNLSTNFELEFLGLILYRDRKIAFTTVHKKLANVDAYLNSEAASGGVLRNFAKFTGKHLSQCIFFNKVAGLRLLRTPFLQNTFGRLLLLIGIHLPFIVENEEQTPFQPAYLICFTVELLDDELKYLEKFFC